MNLRILGLLGVSANLALASASAFAQEPAAPTAESGTTAEAATVTEPAAAPAAPLKLSNKWRIEVSEGANNDGTLLFRVTPDQGTATDVLIPIKKGRSENGVARDIKNALKAQLDPKTYHVENDDGEDVLVKRRKGPNYEVKLVESTLKGTRIDIEKE
jgi:hypothetical protein